MFLGLVLLAGTGFGLYFFFRGLRVFRRYRELADTPRSSILGLAMGFVEVHGKAKPSRSPLINSPVTRTPCFFYKVEILRKLEGEDSSRWKHFKTDTDGVPFYLDDGTGKVLVDAHGAELELSRHAWRETGGFSLRGVFEAIRELRAPMRYLVDDSGLIAYAGSLSESGPSTSRYRFSEYCLLPGHWYDVTGTCVENPEPADVRDRNIIVKGLDRPTFFITWRSESGLKARLRRDAALYVLGGAGLAILSLGFLLSEFGWL